MKKTISLLVGLGILLSVFTQPVAAETAIPDSEQPGSFHVYTGDKPLTPIPEELLKADTRGGEVLFGFSADNHNMLANGLGLIPTRIPGGGLCYKIRWVDPITDNNYLKTPRIKMKANRKYMVSALINFDWSRRDPDQKTGDNLGRELGMHFKLRNGEEQHMLDMRHGMPDYTNGWAREEWTVSPGLLGSDDMENFTAELLVSFARWYRNAESNAALYIADLQIIELPAEPLVPYKEGEGVTFRGTAGDLDMKVEGAQTTDTSIIVNTTGTRYTFDIPANTMTAEQKIGKQRKVSTWKSEASFAGLSVKSTSETECVISNSELTFGVQMDGAVFLTPHKGNVRLVCTSEIPGVYNRLAYGHLMALDSYGGFTVTPDIPAGSGLTSLCEVLTEGLDFPEWEFCNAVAWGNDTYNQEYNDYLSNVRDAGWQIAWTVRPGERLAISTFPPREYDWKYSFDMPTMSVYPSSTHVTNMPKYRSELKLGSSTMWSFGVAPEGMEYGRYYMFDHNDDLIHAMVRAMHDEGIQALIYTSGFFYYNKEDPMEWITEIKRLRDRYNLDGIYSDGLPSEGSWVVAYEEARLLRQLFPSGVLNVHQTGQPGNGGAPLSSPALFLPFLDTYLSQTLKGENIGLYGYANPVANMTWSQYNIANCIGQSKGDYWAEKGGNIPNNSNIPDTVIPEEDQYWIHLINNGRLRPSDQTWWKEEYLPVLDELRELWVEKGNEEEFYEQYFAPKARELVGENLSHIGDIYAVDTDFNMIIPEHNERAYLEGRSDERIKDPVDPLTLYNITNLNAKVVEENGNKILNVSGNRNRDEGYIFKRSIPLSGKIKVEYDLRVQELGGVTSNISNNFGVPGISLKFDKDGAIKLCNTKGGGTAIGRYNRDEWQKVRIEIDTDKHTYDLYVNDKKLIAKLELDKEFYYITNYEFIGGGYGSVFDLDNIKVSYHY